MMLTTNITLKVLACFFLFSVVLAKNALHGSMNLNKLTAANNEFALNLFKQMSLSETKNIFFSPISIANLLGMLLYGAKGVTAKEIRRVLGYNKERLSDELVHETFNYLLKHVFNSNGSYGYTLNSVGMILVEKTLNMSPKYKRQVKELYNATILDADFKNQASLIKSQINHFVKRETNGKISHLLSDVDPASLILLLNAVYFKAAWKDPFDAAETKLMTFHNHDQKPKEVPMMKKLLWCFYSDQPQYQAIRLPYDGDQTDMLVILPTGKGGLPAFVKSLTTKKFNKIKTGLIESEVDVLFPKFKLTFSQSLTKHLVALGIRSLSNGKLDLSGITTTYGVPIDDVIQKTFIEVTEEGTEAAAATEVSTALSMNEEFVADKPFVFVIINRKTGLILFMGQVDNL